MSKSQLENIELKQDLNATIKELSASYEEISLLYRLSETLSGLSVDEICERIVEEAVSEVGAQTAVVLLVDNEKKELFTKSYCGRWDDKNNLNPSITIVWEAIEKATSKTSCSVIPNKNKEIFPWVETFVICPLIGKNKPIGVLMLLDEIGSKEYLSNNLKLLGAISFQASLAIENAYLYNELEDLLLGTIKSFVKVLEASSKWTADHAERVTIFSLAIAKELGIDPKTTDRLKMCALLHDLGKIAMPTKLLDKTETLEKQEIYEIQRHPLIGEKILKSIRVMSDIALGIKYHHEFWDGSKSKFGKKKEEIPLMARILAVADTYDAITSDRPYRGKRDPDEAVREILKNSGTQFDPIVVDAFLRCIEKNQLKAVP